MYRLASTSYTNTWSGESGPHGDIRRGDCIDNWGGSRSVISCSVTAATVQSTSSGVVVILTTAPNYRKHPSFIHRARICAPPPRVPSPLPPLEQHADWSGADLRRRECRRHRRHRSSNTLIGAEQLFAAASAAAACANDMIGSAQM